VGRLATGIAHDFNNLLTAILGYTESMLEQMDADKPIHADLVEVHKAGQSAAALTQQLLAFARKQTLRMRVIDLNRTVDASQHLIRRVIGDDVQVVVTLGEGVHAVLADPVQVEQVLVNLAVNARDAMPDGGVLTIATAILDLRETRPFPWPVTVVPGRYVRLTVADTGCGMNADTQAHLFEPFFTTKGAGRGTGLGLATIYGIVKQLGGYIWVSSELQHGSTFTVYLPATDAALTAPDPSPVSREVAVGRETILVVEDDPAVRALTVSVLTRHGYTVLDAPTPEAAVAIARTQPFDLVLADVMMPGMLGPSLVRQLRQERPGLTRAIYMSGYAADHLTGSLFEEGAQFVAKPFTQADLLRTVKQVLDAQSDQTP
jgi:CheY-like chemotaxis protein